MTNVQKRDRGEESPALKAFLSTLGGRIRTTRLKRGMTQTDLATAARLDRAYLSGVENGKHNITVGAVLRLAAALEVEPESLIALAARAEEDEDAGQRISA